MSKVICDICGTSYPDTADQCPICGCARDFSAENLTDDLIEEEIQETAPRKTAKFAGFGKRTPVFEDDDDDDDFDEDDEDEDEDEYDDDEYDDDDEDDDDDDDDGHKSNAPLVILLVIVILALLAVSGFILVKYFLPNVMGPESTAPSTVETTAAPEETTEPTIPCENLALTSGGDVVLDGEGANWLINVMALPENTTDKLIYASSDESIVTVDEQGKVTAVGEGTAVITITCGEQELQCTITCDFTPETSVPEETTVPPTEPEETEPPTEATEPLKDIKLKVVRWTDLTFNGPNQGFTFVLDGLRNDEVKWTSEDESVVTVDENGFVTSVGRGNTKIICQYGDQKVEITIRCNW